MSFSMRASVRRSDGDACPLERAKYSHRSVYRNMQVKCGIAYCFRIKVIVSYCQKYPTLMNNKLLPLLISFGLVSNSLSAQTILYQETFDGGATSLNNDMPSISVTSPTHGTGGDWTSADNILANGSISENAANSASLAFAPADGFIYELSFTVNYAGSGFTAVGFTGSATYTGRIFNTGGGMLWGATRPGSTLDDQIAHANPVGGTGEVGVAGNTTNPSSLSIILDTTGGSGSWDVEWYVDGAASPFASLDNISTDYETAIEGVSIGMNNSNGSDFQSFQLTVIPEPSTYAMLLSFVALGICLIRRRR